MNTLIRLQKYIADQGICSRRKAEELIRLGKVQVNGRIVTEGGVMIDPAKDAVDVDLPKTAEKIKKPSAPPTEEQYVYLLLNKPVDYDEKNVSEILTEEHYAGKFKKKLLYPVAPVVSIEKNLEGLMIFTNDEETKKQLLATEQETEYEVTINEALSRDAIMILNKGMVMNGAFHTGVILSHLSNRGKRSVVSVIVTDKPGEEVRQMFECIGYHVYSVRRIRFGKIRLGTISVGKWKMFDKKQLF